ncbi:MAG: hypothetical protein V3U60_15440 [Gammaproteobacteria bacterium]
MDHKTLRGVALAAALVLMPTAALACGSAEQKTHVGQVTAVDQGAGSFTIFDVQTATPITFSSDETLLEGLESVRGMVQVKYEHDGDTLRAIDILY